MVAPISGLSTMARSMEQVQGAVGLAEEARQIEASLHERYKKGIQDGEPSIPKARSIESIIRKSYRRLQTPSNAL